MGEVKQEDRRVAGSALEDAVGVPLAEFAFIIAGRTWRIQAAQDHASLMGAVETYAAFPFGLLVWESAQALAEALVEDPTIVAGKNILEVGAGVGFPGIVARSLGAAAVRQTDNLTQALTLCQVNAAQNGVDGIELAVANWDAWTDDRKYDLIIGSDVIYERTAHAPLAAILARNLSPQGRAIIADPGRQDTPLFVKELAEAGWKSAQRQRTVDSMMPGGAETVDVDIIELWR
jgi:predicted nicotinamide N-methyase